MTLGRIEDVTVQEVVFWLKKKGVHGSEVLKFKESGIDGKTLLKVTGDDLGEEFGIVGERRGVVSAAICSLINKYKTYDYPSIAQGSPMKAARACSTPDSKEGIERPVNVSLLSVAKVANLLRHHGAPHATLEKFRGNEVDGLTLFELTRQDLSTELEITSFSDRKAAWAAVTSLLARNTDTTPKRSPHPFSHYYRHFQSP